MRTPLRFVFLLALLAAGCSDPGAGPRGGAGDPPVVGAPIPLAASSTRPAADPGAADRYIAVIAPMEAVDLAPRLAGELTALYVQTGGRVEPGQRVADIDARLVQEELAVAEAALHSARAALRQAEVDIADAEHTVASEERAVAKGASPRRTLEKARFARDRAQAARSHALAAIAEEEARVEKARNRLNDAQIRAPFAGVIAMLYRDPGASVGPDFPVARLIAGHGLRVRFAVPLTDAGRLAPGRTVTVEAANAQRPFAAVIRQIAPELDPASKMIFVEAELSARPAETAAIYPGAAAWVSIQR